MRQLLLKPAIHKFESCGDFCKEFSVGEHDVILTNAFIYEPYFQAMNLPATVIFQERYGSGEPTDCMVEAICGALPPTFERVIAVGGGTVLDIAKLLALKKPLPADTLLDRLETLERDKALVLVPTTCGTGSEMTNISVLAIENKGTKMGLAANILYADDAVLIPELLKTLPFQFFAASSIDALIHAFESCLSPKGNPYSLLFAHQAIRMILEGYQRIGQDGPESRLDMLEEYLLASNYAGIAFGNAGVGAVHAMSYPFGATYHVPHGESNYRLFLEVFKTYTALNPEGRIKPFNAMVARILGCEEAEVYLRLETLLAAVMPHKPLREYGMTPQDVDIFTQDVLVNQTRLHQNFYVMFSAQQMKDIYQRLY